MDRTPDIREIWESAAPGWARWEPSVARWMAPATGKMLELAGAREGARVLDLACGAGSQTLAAARAVGPGGRVLAVDIAPTMLQHVRQRADESGLDQIDTQCSAAEELDVPPGSFDAAICQLGLMLFPRPVDALRAIHRALRPAGRVGVVVFADAAHNLMLSEPMAVLRRHAGLGPPAGGQPGLFSLAGERRLADTFREAGFEPAETQRVEVDLRMQSAAQALGMMQEAFGAYRAVVKDLTEPMRQAAWGEVEEVLRRCEGPGGFTTKAQVWVASARRPA